MSDSKDIEIRNLYDALKAAEYYIDRLERVQMRKRVRDMPEAMEHYQRTAIPVILAFDKGDGMIRDPSDGSVREPQKPAPDFLPPQKSAVRLPSSDAAGFGAGPVLDVETSGLPIGSSKPENLARLEKSREWLENYRKNPLQFRSGQLREGN